MHRVSNVCFRSYRLCASRSANREFLPVVNSLVNSPTFHHQSLYTSRVSFSSQPEEQDATEVGDLSPNKEPEVIPKSKPEKLEETETVVGFGEKMEFQAETRKLLDIVARSLYTDKEIFVRELVSNSSDALEKFRHAQVSGKGVIDAYIEPEIHISTDSESNTLTIQDFGIGMSKEDLISNLGTIARSGTSEYVKNSENVENLIGQFGVGFYSVFMVSDLVTVYTRSALDGSEGYCWKSDGTGSYELAEASGCSRGTKIILKLKEDCKEFSEERVIKDCLTKHSNFVNFPIKLNGERVNTIGAIWTKQKKDISEEEHESFYKFITHLHEKPMMHLHFHTDSPMNLKSLFYIPSEHTEKFGLGVMEPGVSLYCKKVLIQSNMKNLLPDYLRFVKGVVDCEDVPLNLSREHLQDSQLISRLGTVLSRRLIKFFADEAKNDPEKYNTFFLEFGKFIKEGISTQMSDKEQLAKLLRMESSKFEPGKLISLDDYVARMKDDQQEIYYVVAQRREFAESSPYMEHFKKKDIEVLFSFEAIDEWVMHNLAQYKGKKLKAIETAELAEESQEEISEEEREQQKQFNDWIRDVLSEKVSSVKDTNRLTDSPAVIIDHESLTFRRLMLQADPQNAPKLPKQKLEINANHPIMINLKQIRNTNPTKAAKIIEQVYDNALMTAGLLLDSRPMIARINELLIDAVRQEKE